MTSYWWSVVTMGLCRTVSEINGDFGRKLHFFLREFPLEYCDGLKNWRTIEIVGCKERPNIENSLPTHAVVLLMWLKNCRYYKATRLFWCLQVRWTFKRRLHRVHRQSTATCTSLLWYDHCWWWLDGLYSNIALIWKNVNRHDGVPQKLEHFFKVAYTAWNLRPGENERHNLMPLMAFFIAVNTSIVLFQWHVAQCLASWGPWPPPPFKSANGFYRSRVRGTVSLVCVLRDCCRTQDEEM